MSVYMLYICAIVLKILIYKYAMSSRKNMLVVSLRVIYTM